MARTLKRCVLRGAGFLHSAYITAYLLGRFASAYSRRQERSANLRRFPRFVAGGSCLARICDRVRALPRLLFSPLLLFFGASHESRRRSRVLATRVGAHVDPRVARFPAGTNVDRERSAESASRACDIRPARSPEFALSTGRLARMGVRHWFLSGRHSSLGRTTSQRIRHRCRLFATLFP